MGTKIRRKWDLLSEQSGALTVLSVAFLLGGVAGCFFAALSGGVGAVELSSYLADYLTLAQEGALSGGLWPLLWEHLKYFLAALVLSVTALGVIGLPLLFAVRGFAFSFSVACFCLVFGGRGLFPALVLFGLSAVLWAPALFLMGVPGLLCAQRMLRRVLGESGGGVSPGWSGLSRAAVCIGLSIAAGLLEYWVTPVLLQTAARLVL